MKKIAIIFLSVMCTVVSYAQEHNATEDLNPNITPFHDATDAMNGVSYAHLLKQKTWTEFLKKYPTWGANFNRFTQLPHRAMGQPISFAPGGNDLAAKAKAFINTEFANFNISTNELELTRNSNDGKYINVDFKQVHEGKEVLWSRVSFRFTQDYKIVMFSLDFNRNIPTFNPAITTSQAISKAEQGVVTTVINSTVENNLKLFPLPIEGKYSFRPVYVVTVNTQDDKTTPGEYLTYVDAINGEILYRQNKVKHIGFNVTGDLYSTNLFSPLTTLPLKNLQVTVGATNYYTDATGSVTIPGTAPVNATIALAGKFIKIVTGATGTTGSTYSATGIANAAVVNYPQSSPNATERHLTCYYHANEIHDYMKTKFPTFTTMDNQMTARVDRTDGNCNAFYNGSSINFYTTSNGCNALSLISDVMYHEYGHGISDKFWTANGSSFDNGAMGEGYSDIWALSILKTPIIGQGYLINQPSSYIRRYDINPKIYPNSIIGEVHSDGEIIAGAWWDVAVNLSATMPLNDAVDTMSNIFAESQYGLATGPDGAEGQVYHDILIDALQYDDNDNDITNGTPHFFEIVKAFAKHGIYLLNTSEIKNNTNAFVAATPSININAEVIADFPVLLGDVKMLYRKKNMSIVDTITLTKAGSIYTGTFSNAVAGDVFEYIYKLQDVFGNESGVLPYNAEFSTSSIQKNLPYYLTVGYTLISNQDFENTLNSNWVIGNYTTDNETGGTWVVAKPLASLTNGDTVQTGNDHTTGNGKCVVTGNATSVSSSAGTADVDGGRTSFMTDEINLVGMFKPLISYWRWYSNSQGSNPRKDKWRVWYSYYNTSAAGWTNWYGLEKTQQPDVSWRQNIYMPDINFGDKIRFLFTATDSTQGFGGSTIEAAVDDIQVYDLYGSVGVSNIEKVNFALYPNPADDKLTIFSSEKGNAKMTIFNTLGQEILSSETNFNTSHTIDCSNLTIGVYFIKLEINNKKSVQRVVIQ